MTNLRMFKKLGDVDVDDVFFHESYNIPPHLEDT